MNLISWEKEKLRRVYKHCKNQVVLEEFLQSGLECVKVENFTHSTPYVCANALRTSALRLGMSQIIVAVRNGEVFLIRENF